MLQIIILATLCIMAPLHAISVCTKITDTSKHYIVADSQVIIERPSGVGAQNLTQLGEVTTNLNLQYKSMELILSNNNELKLILRNCSSPLAETARRFFPNAAEKVASLFDMSIPISTQEYDYMYNLFENNTSYVEIKKAPYRAQFKFIDLLNVLHTYFPEIHSLIRMPLSTRILYKIKNFLWL